MLSTKDFRFGSISGKIFDFENQGDILERHSHSPADVHFSIIARGSVEVRGDGWKYTATAGQIVDFPPNQFHEFESLEPKSRVVNITKAPT